MPDDIITRDIEGQLAVNTVSSTEANVPYNYDDCFTVDINGRRAVRVVGGAGAIDDNKIIIKSEEIPTASADELGKFYCYSGETNSSFAHGYVYECVDGSTTYDGSVTFEPATLSGTVVTATAGALATLAATYIVGDITTIVSGTLEYIYAGDLWRFTGKDAEDNTVGTFQVYTLDYEEAGFTFTGTPEDGDIVAFTCSISESTSYSWERIDLQPVAKLGRYLSSWNCATGLAGTNPQESPYEYTTGDYFIVGAVAAAGGTNYRPNGSSYVIGQASTTVESSVVTINDTYLYDGTNWTLLKTGSTVTSVNGQTGDVTVQETLVNQTNIKSINGNSLLGSGNLEVIPYLSYGSGWSTTGTTKAFCDDVAADTSAVKGKMYLGEATFSDFPTGVSNGEVVVEVMDGDTAASKVIVLTLTSGNVSPYMWKYTYWNNGSNVSGWIGFQPAGNYISNSSTGSNGIGINSVTNSPNSIIMGNITYNESNGGNVILVPSKGTNLSARKDSVVIGNGAQLQYSDGVVGIGKGVNISSGYSVAIGSSSTIIGGGSYNVAIGSMAGTSYGVTNAIQLGSTGTSSTYNSDSNTFKVANHNGNFEMMSADGTIPADRLTKVAVQYSTMPTASSTIEGKIVEYTGATDSTYTNGYFYKCVSDGATPTPAYSWERVDVQPGSSLPSQSGQSGKFLTTDGTDASWATVGALPDQTGQSGKFLTTDGTDASWSDKPLVNKATVATSLTVGGDATAFYECVNVGITSKGNNHYVTNVGYGASSGALGTAVGHGTKANGSTIGGGSVAVGAAANASGDKSVSIGASSTAGGNNTIAIGYLSRTSSAGTIILSTRGINETVVDANTFYIANPVGTYKLLDSDGTIPADRIADTTGLTAGNYIPRLTIDAQGNKTITWVAE